MSDEASTSSQSLLDVPGGAVLWTARESSDSGQQQASKKLRLSIMRQGAKGADDVLDLEGKEASFLHHSADETRKVVPPIRAEDVQFSPAVAAIMAGYRPPAIMRESPVPPSWTEQHQHGEHSRSLSLPAPSPAPSPRVATPTSNDKSSRSSSNDESSSSSNGGGCCETEKTISGDAEVSSSSSSNSRGTTNASTITADVTNTAGVVSATEEGVVVAASPDALPEASPPPTSSGPSYWSYTAPALFGLVAPTAPSSLRSPAAAAGPFSANSSSSSSSGGGGRVAAPLDALSPWFLSDGAPSFSQPCSLKRKRELDESRQLVESLLPGLGASLSLGDGDTPDMGGEALLGEIRALLRREQNESDRLQKDIVAAMLKP